MRPRRFALVVARFPLLFPTPSGEDYFAEPARMMAEAGFEVEILTARHTGQLESEVVNGLRVHRFVSQAKLMRAITAGHFDLLHAHTHFRPALLTGLLARNTATVFTSHSYAFPDSAWKRRVLVALMNRFDRVIALTPFEQDVYRAAGVDASKIAVLPLPVNVRFFSMSATATVPPVVLFVANLRPVKNPHVVARAFRRVQAEEPAARLIIAGDNLMTEKFETTGWLDPAQLRGALANASVVVNSSSHESFGLSIFEAMAAHRPVCLPDLGSLRSLVGDNALYHSPSDDAGLAANILRYLRDPELRRAHVTANRVLVEDFDAPKVLARYRSLYELLLKR